jgi:MFS transporter, putative metabolite:H+ symporter
MATRTAERAGRTLTPRVSVAARLDRIPPFRMHRRMGVAVGLANFFDLYDIFLGGVLAAVLAEQWGLGTSQKALVISSGSAACSSGRSSSARWPTAWAGAGCS